MTTFVEWAVVGLFLLMAAVVFGAAAGAIRWGRINYGNGLLLPRGEPGFWRTIVGLCGFGLMCLIVGLMGLVTLLYR